MMPSENTEKFDSAPTVNKSSIVMLTPLAAKASENSLKGMPGTGTYAPKRYSAKMPKVNRIFLRSSGTLNASMMDVSKTARPFLRPPRSWRQQQQKFCQP